MDAKAPVTLGERLVVQGNMQSYAAAYVASCDFVTNEARWLIVLRWPNAPGGEGVSRVWSTDEGNVWRRYLSLN